MIVHQINTDPKFTGCRVAVVDNLTRIIQGFYGNVMFEQVSPGIGSVGFNSLDTVNCVKTY